MMNRRGFYDERAVHRPAELNRHYHQLLSSYYRFLVPAGARVLEAGSGLGDLLNTVAPARGVGVDLSGRMVDMARSRHPHLEFHESDFLTFESAERFDYILMSDLVNDLEDVQAALTHAQRFATEETRLGVSFFNTLGRPILRVAEWLGAKAPTPPQNWLSRKDMVNLLNLAGWEVVRSDCRVLWPLATPLLAGLLNRWFAPLSRWICLTLFLVARPKPRQPAPPHLKVSVVIPARNEAGNIEHAVQRVPELGAGTEIVFIEGHSKDNTWDEIQRVAAAYPHRSIRILKQQSKGKGGAVREAFADCTGDVLMILDADLTMPPEQLGKFYDAIWSNTAEFVNGVRLVYPMEDHAMRFLNMVANHGFSLSFSWLLGQPIKDTLCGTKVIRRENYLKIAAQRAYFGDFDPFGDFDLLFGAAKLNLKIVDLPIRYQARTYGDTNIQRWRHGWLLLRMVLFAARRLKFLPVTPSPAARLPATPP